MEWSASDDAIFEENAFAIPDSVSNKFERISVLLEQPRPVKELRLRYSNLFRDLWLISTGEVTRASYTAAREAAAAAGGGVAAAPAGGGRAAAGGGRAARGRGRARGEEGAGTWSTEERGIVMAFFIANRVVERGNYQQLLDRLPGQTAASLDSFLKANYECDKSYRIPNA